MTVIVDFTAFGGDAVTRCVPARPSSGLAALSDAGFSVAMVTSMPGFVCRIDGLPGAGAESCATTPPPEASWSYWTAARGGSWRYSPVGGGGTRPSEGGVEGWAFATGSEARPPSIAPPGIPATPRPTVAPTARPTIRPTPVPATPVPALPSTPVAAAATATPTIDATTAPSAEAPTPPATATATATATASASALPSTEAPTPSADAPTTAGPATPDSSPAGMIVGIGLAGAIGAAALAWRRRRMAGGGQG